MRNQYLQWHLTGKEFEAADKLPTVDKYLLGPRLVRGTDLLKRGEEPAQTLNELLSLRSGLVHPKLLPLRPSDRAAVDPREFKDFNPRNGARYLVAVAHAAGWLMVNAATEPHFDLLVSVIRADRQMFLDFGEAASAALPWPTDPPAPDFLSESIRRHTETAKPNPT